MSSNEKGSGQQDFFDLMGEDGEQWKKPETKDQGPKITDKAREKVDEHNKKYAEVAEPSEGDTDEIKKKNAENAKKRIALDKIKGTGKEGTITVPDVQQEILRKVGYASTYTPPAKAEPEPEVYDRDRIVYYAGHRVEVPTREMKLEQVREMLEQTFPELSKERTDMVYDKESGYITPVLKGHRKGSQWQNTIECHYEWSPWLDTRPVYRLIADNGVYEVRRTQAGRFVAKIRTSREMKEGFVLTQRKIPVEVLAQAIEYFKEQAEVERLVNIVYYPRIDRYNLSIPQQNGETARVEACAEIETDKRYIALQLHSHAKMRPFFSGTDDADEIRTGLYGVIGHCDQEHPVMKLRYSCGGTYRRAYPWEVFEDGYGLVVQIEGNYNDEVHPR